jgi:hypothetical protein
VAKFLLYNESERAHRSPLLRPAGRHLARRRRPVGSFTATVFLSPSLAGHGLAERLFNQPLQSRIANTTIMVIEFH